MKIFLIPLLVIIYISDVFPKPSSQLDTINKWRNDSYCGVRWLAPNGRRAECDPESWRPCCNPNGDCKSYGCTGYGSVDYRNESTACYFGTTYDAFQMTCVDDPICQLPLIPQPKDPQASSINADRGDSLSDATLIGVIPTVDGKWRNDSRCSSDGTLRQYNHFLAPNGEPAQCNPEGLSPCCSEYGWCGGSCAHCRCRLCIDYRDHDSWAGYDHCYTYDNIHKKWVGDQSCIDDPCDDPCLVYDNTEQDCIWNPWTCPLAPAPIPALFSDPISPCGLGYIFDRYEDKCVISFTNDPQTSKINQDY